MSHQLELLSPAGNMERLEMVLHYGADAVYLAGEEFGMRAAAGNFDSDLLPKAVQMAHDKNVDVHVTVNTIPHEGEVDRLTIPTGTVPLTLPSKKSFVLVVRFTLEFPKQLE